MRNNNNMEMKEHAVSPVLLNHKAGALVSLIETVTMLQICLCDERVHWCIHAFQVSYIRMWASDAFCDLLYRFLWYVFRLGRSVAMFVYISARVVI